MNMDPRKIIILIYSAVTIFSFTNVSVVAYRRITLDIDNLWQKYKVKFGKGYIEKSEEEQSRFFAWEETVSKVVKHNIEAVFELHTYEMGLNIFSDLSDEEFRNMCCKIRTQNATAVEVPDFREQTTQPPGSIDWRTLNCITPIADEGYCSACYAFTAVAVLECYQMRKTNNLVKLSEQNIIDCSDSQGNRGCEAGTIPGTYYYIQQNGGIDTAHYYRYEGVKGVCRYREEYKGATCNGYVPIPPGNEHAMMSTVGSTGPVTAVYAASQSFRYYKRGVFATKDCASIDHSLAVIGYGHEGKTPFWLVKNSWGESWGSQGFAKIIRDQSFCGIAAGSGYPLV